MEKKRVITYLILAYGLTYLMGLLMWYGAGRGYDLAVFPSAQMMYPAAGVILGILITNKKEKRLPMGFFITTLIVAGILVLLSIISVISPLDKLEIPGAGSIGVYNLISQYVLILGSIVAFILMLVAGKEKRAAVGLTRRNWGKSAWEFWFWAWSGGCGIFRWTCFITHRQAAFKWYLRNRLPVFS